MARFFRVGIASGMTVLVHRYLPIAAAVVAAILVLPSLSAGLLFDDYVHKVILQRSSGPLAIDNAPWDLFRFLDGDPRRTVELIDYGVLPWWSNPEAKGAFWRPIASATHWLDYQLWPDSPALMHAQSIAWYALLAAVVAFLYRLIMGVSGAAGLAAVLYAVDAAHATPVVFLANRNALIAAALGVLCLAAHTHWRRERRRYFAVLAPLLLLLALLAKEEGIATCAYLAAFAMFLDRGTPAGRIASLLPYAAVVVGWRLAWVALGYGVSGISIYVDPLREPLTFAGAVVQRCPVLLLSQVSTIPAEISIIFGRAGLLSLVAVLVLAVVAFLALPVLRPQSVARFWLAGMLLSLLPAATAFPSDRMLLFAGIGAMGLMAQLVAAAASPTMAVGKFRRVAVLTLAGLVIALHLVLSPVVLLARSAAATFMRPQIESLYIHESLDPGIEEQELILVNPPSALTTAVSAIVWAGEHAPLPRRMRALCSSLFCPVEVRRPDEKSVVLRPAVGFLSTIDSLFVSKEAEFPVGWTRRLTGMEVKVTAIRSKRRPTEVTFTFAVPLEDASLRWMQWRGGRFEPFAPPPVGQSVILHSDW